MKQNGPLAESKLDDPQEPETHKSGELEPVLRILETQDGTVN